MSRIKKVQTYERHLVNTTPKQEKPKFMMKTGKGDEEIEITVNLNIPLLIYMYSIFYMCRIADYTDNLVFTGIFIIFAISTAIDIITQIINAKGEK